MINLLKILKILLLTYSYSRKLHHDNHKSSKQRLENDVQEYTGLINLKSDNKSILLDLAKYSKKG